MLTEEQIFDFLCEKYIGYTDPCQQATDFLYLEAEVHALAHEFYELLLASEKGVLF